MNTEEIQSRLDAIRLVMTGKGLREAVASMNMRSDQTPYVSGRWRKNDIGYDTEGFYPKTEGNDISDMLNDLAIWADTLPSVAERRQQEFTELLAKTIELGKANGIDVQFVNPLVEAMKRLSENALTHRVGE